MISRDIIVLLRIDYGAARAHTRLSLNADDHFTRTVTVTIIPVLKIYYSYAACAML